MTTVILLYCTGTNVTDMQFLYIDLMALVPLSVLQARTGSHGELTKDRPTNSLFYFPVLLSVILAGAIQAAFQIYFAITVKNQPFFIPVDPTVDTFEYDNPSYEGTVLFMVSNFQYLATCTAFNKSRPFRLPVHTNLPFVISLGLLVVLGTLIVFLPDGSFLATFFCLLPFKDETTGESYYDYRAWIAVGILLNSILTFTAEKMIVGPITEWADQRTERKKQAYFHAQMHAWKTGEENGNGEFFDDDKFMRFVEKDTLDGSFTPTHKA